MLDRSFGEIELREMLERATDYRADVSPGRFAISATLGAQRWEVIVEPDYLAEVLLVVTAYAVDE